MQLRCGKYITQTWQCNVSANDFQSCNLRDLVCSTPFPINVWMTIIIFLYPFCISACASLDVFSKVKSCAHQTMKLIIISSAAAKLPQGEENSCTQKIRQHFNTPNVHIWVPFICAPRKNWPELSVLFGCGLTSSHSSSQVMNSN